MAADAEERLRILMAGESRTWVDIDNMVVFGRAHREILRAAETKHADLLVMGAQGRRGVDLALFGSTTQQVVRDADEIDNSRASTTDRDEDRTMTSRISFSADIFITVSGAGLALLTHHETAAYIGGDCANGLACLRGLRPARSNDSES